MSNADSPQTGRNITQPTQQPSRTNRIIMAATPNKNDVLLGRGSIAASHSGNAQFRSIVNGQKSKYMDANKKEKRMIALSIIDDIKSMNPPGRFLSEGPSSDGKEGGESSEVVSWIYADDAKIIEKVCHCLREKKKKKKKEEESSPSEEKSSNNSPQPRSDSAIALDTGEIMSNNLDIHGFEDFFIERGNSEEEPKQCYAQITMREWTIHAMNSVDIFSIDTESHRSSVGVDSTSWPLEVKMSLSLSSDSYLIPALKLAHSLADQICEVEELLASQGSLQRIGGNVPFLPAPGYNWLDRVVVHVPSEVPETSLLNEGKGRKRSEGNNFFYLSASKAQILPPPTNNDEVICRLEDKLHRIFSLGLVFYELFSGGTRPPELQQSFSDNASVAQSGQSDALHYQLPNIQADSAIDFAGALQILDGLGSDEDLLQELNLIDVVDDQNNGKRSRTQHSTNASKKNSSVSVEPLKMQGLPVSLCELIFNMLDCENGALSSGESYCNMVDVRSDLKLMLDKPYRFLHNLDVDQLSLSGLELNGTVFGRDEEFSNLLASYRRSINGESEFAIISGPSGTGKSVLANKFADFAIENGGIFLSGKFDQLQQAKPFSAIASAFNEYCNMLIADGDSPNAINIASTLRERLGRDAHHLVNVIPNLWMVLGPVDENYVGQDCVDAQKRLQYLLCQFVEIISSSSATSVTLFLDDLQWADSASIALINRLLLQTGSSNQSKRFFFLGCCRDDKMSQEHPVMSMISSIRHFGVCATIIPLTCMKKNTINEMISDLLCLSPRLTRTLSDLVYHKTKGNPLFVSRLMLSLSKEGLMRLSLSRRRWEWDEEKIQSRNLPDDVALFLSGAIGQLPAEVQSALCVLSCFGASADVSLIQSLERELGLDLVCQLEVAVAEGLLNIFGGKYRFCHDRVQEATYNLIKAEDRCLFHFQYGLSLCNEMANNGGHDMLFIAVDQVNRGGPSAVTDADQSILFANLNLTAGNKAVEMSDFESAFSFFDHGINFLRKNHWKDHYDLSLQLFEKAANCSFATGDMVNLKILSEQVLTYAQSSDDKLNIMFIAISVLRDGSHIQEAIDKGIAILSDLGEDLPKIITDSNTYMLLEETKSMLSGLSVDELLNYPLMTNSSKIMAMKFLRSLTLSMLMAKPASLPIVCLKMVQLSLSHGMSSLSAIGFVYFGSIQAKVGYIREGYRYVKVAMNLVERFGSKDVAGEVIAIGAQVIAYVEPLQTALEYHSRGRTASMEAGDVSNAMGNMLLQCALLLWSSAKLATTKENCDKCFHLMKRHGNFAMMSHCLPISFSVSTLIGIDNENSSASNGQLTEQNLHEKNPLGARTHYFHKMYIAYMCRKYDDMFESVEKYFEYKLHSWNFFFSEASNTFFVGLASFWIYRVQNNDGDSKWIEKGTECKLAMKNWADQSQWNFMNKLHLLEAEEHFCGKKNECAMLSYDNAIASAREHKFINDEALACELAGYFYLEIGEKNVSLEYFARAHEKYHEWGAFFKASKLFEFVQSIVPSHPVVDRGPFWQFDDNASSSRKRTPPNLS